MLKTELLNLRLKENNGILKTADIVQMGISRAFFLEYVKKNNLEKAAHGIYMEADAWNDGMYLLQTRIPNAIFSHESALYLLDMAEREPMKHTITVKSGYNRTSLAAEGVQVYSIKADLLELGLTTLKSPTGHSLRAYNAERTICDIIRSRSNVEMQDYQAAIKTYMGQRKKNIPLLMRYAKDLRVDKILRQYLEVLF